MKTIHKITLGIALAIAATATCIISIQAKSNIKEALLSQNIEALTATESSSSSSNDVYYYALMWAECSIPVYYVQVTGGTVQISGTYEEVKEYCDFKYSKYKIICCIYKVGSRSYCYSGKEDCHSKDCS